MSKISLMEICYLNLEHHCSKNIVISYSNYPEWQATKWCHTKILDAALLYAEVQEDATASYVLLFKKEHDKAALKRYKLKNKRKPQHIF